ncbi:MAG: hypothetical protein RL582_527, partial [Bacteroidota bacterium]
MVLLHFFVCSRRSLTAPKNAKNKLVNGLFDFEMSQVPFRYTSDSSKPDRSARFARLARTSVVTTKYKPQ